MVEADITWFVPNNKSVFVLTLVIFFVQNFSAWFCNQCSFVLEHGGYTVGGIHTGQHCPRKSARTWGVCLVSSWRHCRWSLTVIRIFTAEESFLVLPLAKMFGSLILGSLWLLILGNIPSRKKVTPGICIKQKYSTWSLGDIAAHEETKMVSIHRYVI